MVLRPDPAAAARLGKLTTSLLDHAGSHHWPTGSPASCHATVLPMEPHRTTLRADDARVRSYGNALARAAACCRPVRLRLHGLVVTPVSVMACAYPADSAAADFAACLTAAVGPTPWSNRDIWYANLLHFAGPIDDPAGLLDWVAARRELQLGDWYSAEAILTAWRYDGRQAVPAPLAVVPFAGAATGTTGSAAGVA